MKIQVTMEGRLPSDLEAKMNDFFGYPTFIEWKEPVIPSVGDTLILGEFIKVPDFMSESDHWDVVHRTFRGGSLIDLYLKRA